MEKIQELVKEGKLAENLMADKEFVEGAKEIFKSENVEMDDKKLAQLMNEIEAQLKKSNVLDKKELEEVSGGALTRKGVARGTVEAISTIVGSVVGLAMGGTGGLAAGVKGMEAITKRIERTARMTGNVDTTLKLGVGAVTGIGTTLGALSGGVLGHKLGKWICKKTGLEEG